MLIERTTARRENLASCTSYSNLRGKWELMENSPQRVGSTSDEFTTTFSAQREEDTDEVEAQPHIHLPNPSYWPVALGAAIALVRSWRIQSHLSQSHRERKRGPGAVGARAGAGSHPEKIYRTALQTAALHLYKY